MRSALPVLLLLLAGVPAHADERRAEAHAFVAVETERKAYVVGEPFRVVLRFGIDRAFFDEHAVPLFRREMDVLVQVEAPFLRELSDTVRLDETRGGDARFALNGGAGRATRVDDVLRDGRAFEVYELSASFQRQTEGEATLSATLRFAHATRFEEDFLGARVAVDRRDAVLRAEPLVLGFHPLPEAGRPAIFDGAIGRFRIGASLAPATGESGGNLTLTLVLEGEGNLASCDPPGADRLPGFHVYGVIDDHGTPRRTIAYEIAPLGSAVSQIPPIPFAFFDPTPPAGYRVVHTKAIPLPDRSRPSAPIAPAAAGRSAAWLWILLGSALVVALLLLVVLRRRRRVVETPLDDAAARRRARLEAGDVDGSQVLADVLATLLDVSPAAVIGSDLAARLASAGVSPDLADRTARTLERLVAARFGGKAAPRGDDLATLIDELEDAFRPQG